VSCYQNQACHQQISLTIISQLAFKQEKYNVCDALVDEKDLPAEEEDAKPSTGEVKEDELDNEEKSEMEKLVDNTGASSSSSSDPK